MNSEPEIINETRLFVDGYVYLRSSIPVSTTTYWKCPQLRQKQCGARAITVTAAGKVTVIKGPEKSPHTHPPNREFAEAEKIKVNLKRKATANPEEPPSRLIRNELAGVAAGVVAQLPERENLKKSVRIIRRKNLPKNPISLEDLPEITNQYSKTATGDKFLIYDSKFDDEESDDTDGRVIVFATRRNIELLSSSRTWFLDGTFKVKYL